MSDWTERLSNLSPKKRELLELKLKKKGLLHVSLNETVNKPDGHNNEAKEIATDGIDHIKMKFGLFFFSSTGQAKEEDIYELLLETTKFADQNGFSFVSVPERHFRDFGGLYPNPSVIASALAVVSENIQIRSGSVVMPLHHPIRIAEEWSVVDNLSKGRVGLSFGTGWNPRDFVFNPENYDHRREITFQGIQTLRKLWAGEEIIFKGFKDEEVTINLSPKPMNKDLPVWITSSGSSETWIKAGEMGTNVLAALISQNFNELAHNIRLYRDSLQRHGFRPDDGVVTVMLHTFLGDDDENVKEKVRSPMYEYLSKFLAQQNNVTKTSAGNSFENELENIIHSSKEDLLAFSFERYYKGSSLLGTPDKCEKVIEKLGAMGVNEIGCLIDFGLDLDSVMESLEKLTVLRKKYSSIDLSGDEQ
ncbi:siderophore biosynthesis protein [Paenibacillus silvae]|uniref:Siderophore biosynthesis protein n=1 Tax=Paenibacillus silvae TaxID=1325358 RepID=A0ABQ1Z7Y1_9BACL|nr:MupA/Atu3671 family FMN-dependent luciferase-like monooxygenase [Paenibacillus silvae]GGH50420.1 siderophore biosynthesis protein [Paenibacillus silvae]